MPRLATDRMVHASYDGMEIVRYDRSGKYYLEPTDGGKRQRVKIAEAVAQARWGIENANGKVRLGLPGGERFDHLWRQTAAVSSETRKLSAEAVADIGEVPDEVKALTRQVGELLKQATELHGDPKVKWVVARVTQRDTPAAMVIPLDWTEMG
jgi:hypothetical protein